MSSSQAPFSRNEVGRGGPRVYVENLWLCRQSALKRAFDLAGAVSILLCVGILFILVTALMVAAQGRPIFHRHKRVGLAGREFDCLKFRTMVTNGEEILEEHFAADAAARWEWAAKRKLMQDPRVTPLGRILRMSSIDELPQLVNIIKGDMSLVGPRPIVQDELRHYGPYAAEYQSVRPGLTGLWQVSGRNDVSYQERVRMDCEYLANMSLATDINIILRTVPAVFKSRGSY